MVSFPDEVVRAAAEAALSKKAEDVVALDVSEVCSFTQTLLICHGQSQRQVVTIAEAVQERLAHEGRRPHHVEGETRGEWVLLDYFDLVVHVFQQERRRFYSLERLWGDTPRHEFQDAPAAAALPARSPKRGA
jgi:ribosome-associated protein